MAVYKVIQDIEAEDKILGPLSLKGFVYAAAAVLLGFINFKLMMSVALGPVKWILILFFLAPMILFAVLASPLGREQPTEVWLLARIRFLTKPRKRIWSQLGLSHLVTITAPKKVDQHLTKDLTQNEVNSRLEALAQTLDSRGWAIKNVAVNLNAAPNYFDQTDGADRLVATSEVAAPQEVVDVRPSDDILDADNNPTAQKFEGMMKQAEQSRKQDLQARLERARKQGVVTDHSTADTKSGDAEKMLAKMHQRAKVYNVLTGAENNDAPEEAAAAKNAPVTEKSQTVKMELAQSGNAFSVATIANLANRGENEVVVPLH